MMDGIKTDESLPFDNNLIHAENDLRAQLRNIGRYLLSYRKISNNKTLSLLQSFEKEYHKYLPEVVKDYTCNYKHATTPDKLQSILGEYLLL